MFGWGPAFTVSYAIGGLMHLRWSGARAWRPVAVWALVGTAAGQLGIFLGLVYSHLSSAGSHVVAWTGSLIAVFFVRQYALAVQERERVLQEAEQHDRRFAALVQTPPTSPVSGAARKARSRTSAPRWSACSATARRNCWDSRRAVPGAR